MLTGTNFVRFSRRSLHLIRKQWGKLGDRMEVRRQSLKLRFWDERDEHPPGMLLDHTYESIKSLPDLRIYELRIDDQIGRLDNIRVVFFDPPADWNAFEDKGLRALWILEVLQKKRDNWTENDISRFRAARLLIKRNCYDTN